jgi:hypothetical protein
MGRPTRNIVEQRPDFKQNRRRARVRLWPGSDRFYRGYRSARRLR